jgi:hypothetical protein
MDVSTAGAYLSLSEHAFKVVTARADLRPVNLGLRLQRYRRADLDKLLKSLPVAGPALDADTAAADQAAERALARVGSRSRPT